MFTQEIHRHRSIQCPFCRETHNEIRNVTHLPKNNYALQVARLAKENQQLQSLLTGQDSSSGTDNISSLKTQLDEMKTVRQLNLSHAIEMRKEISTYLSLVLDSIRNAEKEITGQIEENERFVSDLVSFYEEGNQSTNQETSNVMELQSLANSCQIMWHPDDTEETIKEKMSRSIDQSREKYMMAFSSVTELRKWKKTRFVYKAYDSESVRPLFNSNIKVDWTTTPFSTKDLNLLLLSHLICYVIQPENNASAVEDDDDDYISRLRAALHSTDSSSSDSSSESSSDISGYLSSSAGTLRERLRQSSNLDQLAQNLESTDSRSSILSGFLSSAARFLRDRQSSSSDESTRETFRGWMSGSRRSSNSDS
jgi:hypothetical protein